MVTPNRVTPGMLAKEAATKLLEAVDELSGRGANAGAISLLNALRPHVTGSSQAAVALKLAGLHQLTGDYEAAREMALCALHDENATPPQRAEGVVAAGRAPTPAEDTPAPPTDEALWPGVDPVFANPGDTLDLVWEAEAPAFQIEILPVGLDYVLYQRDVGPPPYQVKVPWSGAFRWRVASRDERGLEGVPSTEGLICIDLVK